MASSIKLKEVYEVGSKHGAFYTGGNVEWVESIIYCQTEANINLLDIDTGVVVKSVGEEESEDVDSIHTFTTDGAKIVSAHKSGLLKLWNENGELEKTWKSIHKGPIAKLVLNGVKLASGGSDGIIRIWDLELHTCLLSLKGCQGVVSVLAFGDHENILLGSGDDGNINSYELEKGVLKTIYAAHYNKVTSISFAHNNKHFISGGRDKVIVLWEFNQSVPLKTIAVYETIETIVSLPKKFKLPGFRSDPESVYVASAGEKGIVRVWNVSKGQEVFIQSNSLISESSTGLAVTHLRYNSKSKSIAVISAEHNIIIYHLKSFVCLKQFVGFSGEILDIVYVGKDNSHTAVATNSADIKLFNNASMSCQLLKGHTDLVLALSVSKKNNELMLSSGKDNTIRLWHFTNLEMICIAVGKRHTGSVGSVCFAQNSSFAVSASQDQCLKVWEIPNTVEGNVDLNCIHTQIAHQKEINSVAVSPNDKILATASQDKTIKLWTDTLDLLGTLKGHKRGVWCVRFSPTDQIVVSCSADCTIKLWSVADLGCLRTLEGHESSVLRVEFLSKGLQVLSTGADGLIKLFNVKNSYCQNTMDQHEGRIWALAIKDDESEFVTGGSDSFLIRWKDVTEEKKQQKQKEEEELTLIDQQLSNYIHNDELLKALKLSLNLNRPLQTLKIIERVIKKRDIGLADTIKNFDNEQKMSLLKCALDWNMNSRNSQPAQLVLNILLQELQSGNFRPVGLSSLVEGALPYTERHYKRLTQMMQDIHLLNYTVNCMKPNLKYTHNR